MVENLRELVNPNLRISPTFANHWKDNCSWKILKWGNNPTYQTNLKPVLKLISERNYMILCQNKYFGSKLWLFSSSFERLRCMHIFFQEIRPDTYKGFYLLQSFIQGSNMPTEAFFLFKTCFIKGFSRKNFVVYTFVGLFYSIILLGCNSPFLVFASRLWPCG